MKKISIAASLSTLILACTPEVITQPTNDVSAAAEKMPTQSFQNNFTCDDNKKFWIPKATDDKQFISIGFDGSYNNFVWKDTLDFAKENDVKFTFYIVGNHLLTNEQKMLYAGPKHKRGRSDVGFGGTKEQVAERLENIRRAYREGHEIASHANGHFDGSNWTKEEWISELSQFEDFVRNAYSINGIKDTNPTEWKAIADSIIGFRAPLLAHNTEMYHAMDDMGYEYDTSYGHKLGYIPRIIHSNIMGHPLAIIQTEKGRTLSMDYNFYFRDKDGSPDAFENMIQAYRLFLEKSEQLGRVPMQIGHHFSRWNEGAYWNALKTFIGETCSLDHVECGTNTQLTRKIMETTCETKKPKTNSLIKVNKLKNY